MQTYDDNIKMEPSQEMDGTVWPTLYDSRQHQMTNFCEHDNQSLGSINDSVFCTR